MFSVPCLIDNAVEFQHAEFRCLSGKVCQRLAGIETSQRLVKPCQRLAGLKTSQRLVKPCQPEAGIPGRELHYCIVWVKLALF